MENMENNVVMNEAVAEAADVATNATVGQKVLGRLIGTLTVVGAVTVTKKAVKDVRCLIDKVKTYKPKKNKAVDSIVDSEDETE